MDGKEQLKQKRRSSITKVNSLRDQTSTEKGKVKEQEEKQELQSIEK